MELNKRILEDRFYNLEQIEIIGMIDEVVNYRKDKLDLYLSEQGYKSIVLDSREALEIVISNNSNSLFKHPKMVVMVDYNKLHEEFVTNELSPERIMKIIYTNAFIHLEECVIMIVNRKVMDQNNRKIKSKEDMIHNKKIIKTLRTDANISGQYKIKDSRLIEVKEYEIDPIKKEKILKGSIASMLPEIRNKVIERDDYCCALCGSEYLLEVHHVRYSSSEVAELGAKRNLETNLINICKICHTDIHNGNVTKDKQAVDYVDAYYINN